MQTNLLALLASALAIASALPQQPYQAGPGTACGGGLPSCPSGQRCRLTSDRCTDITICAGVCEPIPGAVAYPACSVSFAGDGNHGCPATTTCIVDPRSGGSLAADGPAICIPKEAQMCGGIAGRLCLEEGKGCYEDPRDGCDPKTGGRDCAGICV